SGRSMRRATLSATTKAMPKTSSRLEYQTERRNRTVRVKAGGFGLKDVTLPSNGFDKLVTEPLVYLPPEIVHVHLHGLRKGVRMLVPNVLQELFLRDSTSLVPRKVVHERELFGREVNF